MSHYSSLNIRYSGLAFMFIETYCTSHLEGISSEKLFFHICCLFELDPANHIASQ